MNDRERLIELLKAKYDHYCDQCGVNKQTDYIENLADHLIANGVTVQKHGRWLDGICTNCGVEALEYVDEEGDWLVYTTDYCPNCGAKMSGGEHAE